MNYDTVLFDPIRETLMRLGHYLPTLLIAFGILIIGYVLAHAIERGLVSLFKSMDFDKGILRQVLGCGLVFNHSQNIVIYLLFKIVVYIFEIRIFHDWI